MHYRSTLAKDKKLRPLLDKIDVPALKKKKQLHLQLCDAVISQQLSVTVATVIFNRFMALFEEKTPKPAAILAIPINELRQAGLSNAKANYLHNICRFFLDNGLTDAKLHRLTDDELINLLTQIKGIGRWTVEMILISAMAREDVFAVDDLGIRQSMCKLYGLENTDAKQLKLEMVKIAEKWKPYRTYACRYLWRWKDE
jgi:DNA-3-methyladenine glycosylase II